MNISDYWSLPPSDQSTIRDDVKEYEEELQRVVGCYTITEENRGGIRFLLFCSRCYYLGKSQLTCDYTTITKEEYLDTRHEMHGETCEKCKMPLA